MSAGRANQSQHTMSDLASEWLIDAVVKNKVLKGRLPKIISLAEKQTAIWQLAQDQRVRSLRQAVKDNPVMRSVFSLKRSGAILKSLWVEHNTVSAFMRPYVYGLRRWQQWMARSPPALSSERTAPLACAKRHPLSRV